MISGPGRATLTTDISHAGALETVGTIELRTDSVSSDYIEKQSLGNAFEIPGRDPLYLSQIEILKTIKD